MATLMIHAGRPYDDDPPRKVTIQIGPDQVKATGEDPQLFEREGRQLYAALRDALPSATMDRMIAEHAKAVRVEQA